MKIRIYSDLHLELMDSLPVLDLPPVDLVILAGDIHKGTQGISWAKKTFKDQPVVYVMGNHEYYDGDLIATLAEARSEAAESNVHLLEQDALELPHVTILGCTLWTDFKLLLSEHQKICMANARHFMADYTVITCRGRTLDPEDTMNISKMSYSWLDRKISGSIKPIIVVTHHGQSMATKNPRYELDDITASFNSNYDALLRSPVKLWVTGHTHHCIDSAHHGVRLISHQKGYPHENIKGFDWETVFDVSI